MSMNPSEIANTLRAEIDRLRAVNAALIEALEGLNAAYLSIQFHARQDQIAALETASKAAADALTLAKGEKT